MWSRRDQLQAYQFLRRRLVSAVLLGDANHTDSPSRRSVLSTVTGFGATLLLLAGFGIWGALRPGSSTAWRDGDRVVIERETGTRFVLGRDASGTVRLHRALNLASAKLFLGENAATVTTSRRSIAAAERGHPIGIEGAPDSLPTALATGPWQVCARTAYGPGRGVTPTVNVTVGAATGVDAQADSRALAPGEGLLVRDVGPGGGRYLITDGRRFEIDSDAAARVLGYGFDAAYLPVGTAWIDSVPAGPALGFRTEPTSRRAGPPVRGQRLRVGQVIVVEDGASAAEFYVYRTSGLVRISELESRLIADRPDHPWPAQARRTATRADLLDVPTSTAAPGTAQAALDLPEPLPVALPAPRGEIGVCAAPAADATRITVTSRPIPVGNRSRSPAARASSSAAAGTVLADDVTVPPSRIAVVRAAASADFDSPAFYLVTDEGRRYQVAGRDTLRMLGYADTSAQRVPSAVLTLVPEGPLLDPRAARTEHYYTR